MAKRKVRKCLICGVRPASTDKGFCKNCQAQIEAEKRHRRTPAPWRYVTYREVTVAFHRNGGSRLSPEITKRDPAGLPQKRLIDLNTYCPGFTRQQVKKLKRLCLSFAKNN